jgi:small-conductance mechanosensitive channel
VVLIIIATRVLIAVTNAFFDAVERGTIATAWTSADTARASRRLIAAALWLFAAVIAYPYIPGSGTDAFKGVSVFVGVIVSLGSAGLVNQLMSGLTLTYSRGLRVGDAVQTGEVSAASRAWGCSRCSFARFRGELITVPNAVVVGQSMTNYTRTEGTPHVNLHTEVTIGYYGAVAAGARDADARGRTNGPGAPRPSATSAAARAGGFLRPLPADRRAR